MKKVTIKYVLKPGYIKVHGRQQFVSSHELMLAHEADPAECVIVQFGMPDEFPTDLRRLAPRANAYYIKR